MVPQRLCHNQWNSGPGATMETGICRFRRSVASWRAFLSRFWQAPSQASAGDGAVNFGITMASNMGFSVVKEFLPDLARVTTRKRKSKNSFRIPNS